ncbi:MAG: IS630 family transposase [Burkholderiales bacterium]
MERSGLRLQLMKQQALAGDIVLLFADESEALTHPYLARAWAKRGADLRVEAPGQMQKIAMMGALDFVSRQLTVVTSQTKRSTDFIALLERLDRIHGPKPGEACKPVTIVLDNGPIHASKATCAALAQRKHWLTPEWMAKYAPELNDIERDWKTLKAHHLAHKTFKNRDSLKATIDADIQAINSSRKSQPLANQRISA